MLKKEHIEASLLSLFGRSNPLFYNSIYIELQRFIHSARFSLYSFETEECLYWYGIWKIQDARSTSIFYSQGKFKEDKFTEGLREFTREVGITAVKQRYQFLGDDAYIRTALKYMERLGYVGRLFPTINYYMTEEQEKLLNDFEIPEPPEGYELGSSKVEDAELITKAWIHAGPGEVELTKKKISNFPSSCIRFQGKPVAFEMVNVTGILNHLFVSEEHRRKGLGNIVELDLAKKKGIVVYKNVETHNKAVIDASAKSIFWKRVEDDNGGPVIRTYLGLRPREIQ